MAIIELSTTIQAPIHICFDVSRDIDVHQQSTSKTNEKAIAGRTTGLCEEGDKITWQAKHLGLNQKLTVEITKMKPPFYFEDKMLKGAFKSMVHKHFFEARETSTLMKDHFHYVVPFGFAGKFFDRLFLEKYMTKFLLERNQFIKQVSELRQSSEK